MAKTETESVRLEKGQVDRVRVHVAASKYTIGGYISMLVGKHMDKVDKKKEKK